MQFWPISKEVIEYIMFDRSYVYYNEALELYCGEICKTPRMAIIYIVYGCNFSCRGCLCANYNMERVFMNFEDFKKITLQLKKQGVKSIEFCGGGEPLLHPDIAKMISWVTDNLHMSLGIMTNGSLLNEQVSYLIATRVNYVRISLYDNSYKVVMKKMLDLIRLKNEVEGEVVIGAKFLVDTCNQELVVERVKELLQLSGINYISVKAKRGEAEIQDYSKIEHILKSLENEKVLVDLKKSYLKGRCWMSPIHTLIDPFGDVYICCYYMDRKKEHCIGNVFEKEFSEIWGSEEHIKKISKINPKHCNVFDCRWHKYNEDMLKLLSENTHHQFC